MEKEKRKLREREKGRKQGEKRSKRKEKSMVGLRTQLNNPLLLTVFQIQGQISTDLHRLSLCEIRMRLEEK